MLIYQLNIQIISEKSCIKLAQADISTKCTLSDRLKIGIS
jgi:hypothetical protein